MEKGLEIYGIDFSGAKNAGNKTWIAKGIPDGKRLLIQECFRARDLPNSGKGLDACLPALVNLVTSNRNAAFGFDFPFGLPRSLIHAETWATFILAFPSRFRSPEDFKERCFAEAGNRELRRRTDQASHTPFSPYNRRIYKQTFYGICKVLFPLVQNRNACVLPFHEPVARKPWVLEICPASTLRDLDLNGRPYKKGSETQKGNRRQILADSVERGLVQIDKPEITHKIIEDNGGDALDSVIAAMAAYKASREKASRPPEDQEYMIEGYVYH